MQDTANTSKLAERIKVARGLSGLSQEKAADALGVTTRTYIRWENGESDGFMQRLDDIAQVLKTTPMELVGDAGVVLAEMAAEQRRQGEILERIAASLDV